MEKLANALDRRGINVKDYFAMRDEKTKKVPLYKVREEDSERYLYSDDDLAKIKEGSVEFKMTDERIFAKEVSDKAVIDVMEIYEAREIDKIAKELEKIDLDLALYPKQEADENEDIAKEKEKTALFTVNKKKKVFSLKKLLEVVLKDGEEGVNIQRYKGLGEMNPEQLWETTMDPARRTLQKVTIEDAVEADTMFTVLMGDDVDVRRNFIISHAREVKNLDI
ncbi:DNA gyrase subunit B [Candidatus Omnitrophus magneticus]|uniref:DNA topoisomerase (ATP-hydrolyzing) n=1 Tax=Candidatus Omnitrophus magneticus TaxID=1609969 RepID=A0A0F0CSL8_9BACT|nr:DNA gyrase subunit B [Candidatus Omnitrophus magneticus]